MSKPDDVQLWQALTPATGAALEIRNYRAGSFAEQVATTGVDAGRLATMDRAAEKVAAWWIPGVEVFPRTIYPQRHRGSFGEFVRRDEGPLARIGFWPAQWAAARMFAQTAKGFHVHPPFVPENAEPAAWLRKLFVDDAQNFAARPYDREQWDVMFFPQGVAEMILREGRAGFPPRTLRFFIDGDNHRGANNVGVVIPPGVAHAIRVEGSEDLLMVYGTSTSFRPEFEGRIAADVESATLPESWQRFLGS